MSNNILPAFYATCAITLTALVLATALALHGRDPDPEVITRLLNALISIARHGAEAVFAVLALKPGKPPVPPTE